MAECAIRNFTINFGPQHPAAHGVLRLVLELDGEVVTRVDPHIGLLHRGTEKLIEHKTYLQAAALFDRLDYVAPMNQEHAFCLAAEKLLGLARPQARPAHPRALLRNRPLALASPQRDDAGAGRRRAHPSALGLRRARKADGFLRARLWLRAARFNYFRIGGVHQDLPGKLIDDISRFCTPFLQVCDDLEGLLTESRIFKQRNVGIAVVKLDDAWVLGFSGVMVRGSGAAWDLRKSQPYECYDESRLRHPRRQERRLL